MTKEKAQKALPLVQALADGKTIQFNSDIEGWNDCISPDLDGKWDVERYRIKPEPRALWINEYKGSLRCHPTLEIAKEKASPDCIGRFRVIEILD